jgi:NAD(P)-dependent dehydrogenase (short-subunit alcohol dehydrogenase family)
MLPDLTGEIAIVTGVRGRLGPVWISALIAAGATVVGLDLKVDDATGLHGVADTDPDRLILMEVDVTDAASVRSAVRRCLDGVGVPSVLVNSAGLDAPPGTNGRNWHFGDVPDAVSGAILDVNSLGVLRMCQAVGPLMAERGNGSIVNIGSLYGSVAPDPRMYDHLPGDPPFLKPPAYGMSKAAVAALTRYLAVLWGPHGVRVNTLSPGGVLAGQDQQFQDKFVARVPMRRMATAADLTGPLLFLSSAQSRYVTGTELLVDGGFVCR